MHHSLQGVFALREGPWKFVPSRGSGGFSFPKNIKPAAGEPTAQLYNLATDPHETHNVAATEAAIATRLRSGWPRFNPRHAPGSDSDFSHRHH